MAAVTMDWLFIEPSPRSKPDRELCHHCNIVRRMADGAESRDTGRAVEGIELTARMRQLQVELRLPYDGGCKPVVESEGDLARVRLEDRRRTVEVRRRQRVDIVRYHRALIDSGIADQNFALVETSLHEVAEIGMRYPVQAVAGLNVPSLPIVVTAASWVDRSTRQTRHRS